LAEGEGEGDVGTACSYAKCAFKFEVKDINIVMPKLLKLARESYVIRNSGYQLSPFLLK
jgi:hypothetical protein